MLLKTTIKSWVMNFMASDTKRSLMRGKAFWQERIAGEPTHVKYFHQVDDPYSHLVVHHLDKLMSDYDLPFEVNLVSAPSVLFQGDASRFAQWALDDASQIAEFYSVTFPEDAKLPSESMVGGANNQLIPFVGTDKFAAEACRVGDALWSGNIEPSAANRESRRSVDAGNKLRARKGHYLGGMFYFCGEWYWGLDRLHYLEDRLQTLGFSRNSGPSLPAPQIQKADGLNAENLKLEYFPSLRSPYSAIGHARVLDLVERSGVNLVIRPVMPMMMRGVPAPFSKQSYIVSDTAREAKHFNVPFGNIVDPFGEPVKKAFSLFPWATRQGKAQEFVTEYLSAAWAKGVDITTDLGLRQVVEAAGLSWSEALLNFQNDEWEKMLDENVNDMLAAGLWGVPSFRITGGNTEQSYACWGQDRIWRVEEEIVRRNSNQK